MHRRLLKIGIRHLMEQPVYTALLTEMMERYIRRFRGIIGDGIAHQVQKEVEGVFTITEERAGTGSNKGWGKLKSGAGWISLDYVKRL